MTEIWKPIKGYEGKYEISNLGRIKSLKKHYRPYEIILKPKLTRDGYHENALIDKDRRKYIRTHRLVAMAFIPNPLKKPEVNHIDGNKLNNNVENLEWVTSSENQIHAYKTGLQKVSGNAVVGKKPIRCVNLRVTKSGVAEMQRFLFEEGYTESKKPNRLIECTKKQLTLFRNEI